LLFATLAIGLLTKVFADNLFPTPEHRFPTEEKRDNRPVVGWGGQKDDERIRDIPHVSDDGCHVILARKKSQANSYEKRLTRWETATGQECTPAHWNNPEWDALMSSMYEGRRLGLEELLSTETGRKFVHDEKAWRLLHGRLADARDQSMLWTKPMSEPPEWRAKFDVYPREMHFAPNGRSIAYVSRDDRAIFPHEKWKEADGMAIEEIDSGRKVAFLAGVRNRFQISPAGDLAIQNIYNRDGGRDEQPALALWDITHLRRVDVSSCQTRRRNRCFRKTGGSCLPLLGQTTGKFVGPHWSGGGIHPMADSSAKQEFGTIGTCCTMIDNW